jgi:hypothetical protein
LQICQLQGLRGRTPEPVSAFGRAHSYHPFVIGFSAQRGKKPITKKGIYLAAAGYKPH